MNKAMQSMGTAMPLVACAGVSLKAAAAMLNVPLTSAAVFAEGDVDLRGTLGGSDDVPVGFREIRLRFEIDSPTTKVGLAVRKH